MVGQANTVNRTVNSGAAQQQQRRDAEAAERIRQNQHQLQQDQQAVVTHLITEQMGRLISTLQNSVQENFAERRIEFGDRVTQARSELAEIIHTLPTDAQNQLSPVINRYTAQISSLQAQSGSLTRDQLTAALNKLKEDVLSKLQSGISGTQGSEADQKKILDIANNLETTWKEKEAKKKIKNNKNLENQEEKNAPALSASKDLGKVTGGKSHELFELSIRNKLKDKGLESVVDKNPRLLRQLQFMLKRVEKNPSSLKTVEKRLDALIRNQVFQKKLYLTRFNKDLKFVERLINSASKKTTQLSLVKIEERIEKRLNQWGDKKIGSRFLGQEEQDLLQKKWDDVHDLRDLLEKEENDSIAKTKQLVAERNKAAAAKKQAQEQERDNKNQALKEKIAAMRLKRKEDLLKRKEEIAAKNQTLEKVKAPGLKEKADIAAKKKAQKEDAQVQGRRRNRTDTNDAMVVG